MNSHELLLARLARFATSGALTTGLHVAIASLAVIWFDLGSMAANAVAFVAANLTSYLLNALWTFQAGISVVNYRRFLTVTAICFMAVTLISAVFDWFGSPPIYSVICMALIIPPLSFVAHNLWTFR